MGVVRRSGECIAFERRRMFLRIPGSRGSPTKIATSVEHVLQKMLKPWNVLQISLKPWNAVLQKVPKPWNKPVKSGGRWLVIKRFAFIRVIRGQKRFQKLQKPWNRANLSEFQNLRSRPGSELPKKMLTQWLSNS